MRFWSTVPRSMLSLYMSMTGGVNWGDVIPPLGDIHELYVVLFVGYIITSQLAVLNVLTGVFCQNAIESAAHDQELVTQAMLQNKEGYVKKVTQMFDIIDKDNSGTITIQELKTHLEDERLRTHFESMELDTSDAWTLFKLLDADEGNLVDMDEFITGFMRLKGHAKCIDMAKLSYEHKWMSRRLASFMKRTDDSLEMLRAFATTVEQQPAEPAQWC